MPIQGSCLCGKVCFEITKAVGPFEICHCNRCRKKSGSNGLTMMGVLTEDYRLLSGRELVKTYVAPILSKLPPYHSYFCSNCGSILPPPDPEGTWLEIPAGLLDNDPQIKPDKHIYVEFIPPWDEITDELPQYNVQDLAKERYGVELPRNYHIPTHYDTTKQD